MTQPARLDIQAGIVAVVFPGAGHFYRGERRRALYAALGVMFLFFGGLFIGGIDAVDSVEKRLWFGGQALVGPTAFVVDYAHQNHFRALDPADRTRRRTGYPNERQAVRTLETGQDARVWVPADAPDAGRAPNIRSVAQENEIGRLFCTIAGMVNLIVILDALFPIRPRPEEAGARKGAPA